MIKIIKMVKTWLLPLALLWISLKTSYVHCAFTYPTASIPNLASWASVTVSQVCGTTSTCHGSFNASNCAQNGLCQDQKVCNGRTALPPEEHPLTDWQAPNSAEGCLVSSDAHGNPPSTLFPRDGAMTLTVNGSASGLAPCFSQKSTTIDDSFSLVFWMKADCSDCSILEMPQSGGAATIDMRVKDSTLCIDSDCITEPKIGQQNWLFVSVRVHRGQMKIFLGGDEGNFQSSSLGSVNIDNLYIGSSQTIPAGDLFHLYDVRYYSDALTKSEIDYLEQGLTDQSLDFAECQCPNDFMDVDDADHNFCTNGQTTFPRFNITADFNDANVTVDGDTSTRWASSDQGDVTLILSFGMSFQIESIEMTFASHLPERVARTFISNNEEKERRLFQCSENTKTCKITMQTLDTSSTVQDLEAQVADQIKIELYRQQGDMDSFVISEIKITGRCDCNGNADSCNINSVTVGEPYNCSCNADTNTEGPNCKVCSPNFYRTSGQFDCPSSCQCNADGVVDAGNQCEENGGKCKCKEFVSGEKCDTCKNYTYNLDASNLQGCTECNCYQTGSEVCSNQTGVCVCKPNTKEPRCDECDEFHYGLENTEGCQPCNCETAGTEALNKNCHQTTGQCSCKKNVEGLMCDTCKDEYYYLETANPQGCKQCDCNTVGMENGICNKTTGQCSCRGGVDTNRECAPVMISVDPLYGPEVGGTVITIEGQLLGNESHGLHVFLDNTPQTLISITDSRVMFQTVEYQSGQKTAQLKLSWQVAGSPLSTSAQFTYRPNPVLSASQVANVKTFASGGCPVEFYGNNFASVKYPRLQVASKTNSTLRSSANCRHRDENIVCPTPDVKRFFDASEEYEMTLIMDGVSSSSVGTIDIQPDPELNSMGEIRFQYPFEETIVLEGKNLKDACGSSGYSVLLGVVSCAIKSISDSQIECEPPGSPPGNDRHVTIQVRIGNIQKNVGTLKYLELYETTGFIIIISCIAGAILIVVGAIIILCCCRCRRTQKSASPAMNLDSKPVFTPDDRPMNTYSELTTPVDVEDTPIRANGHNGVVRMETVVREPKKGIVNTEAEDTTLSEEFLPKVDHGLREDLRQCFVGSGHFALGRHCILTGQQARLIDGSLQTGSSVQKLTIKSLLNPVTGSELPHWANLALSECLRLRKYKHTHLLSIAGIGVDQNRFHILYPHMSQYILKTMVSDIDKDLSARQLLSFGQQVAEGIDFLASKDITHKDVAARNCMVDEFSVVKLCDASFSWDFYADEYTYDEQRERYIPVRWMAPESITDGYYDMRTDVWSFAVLVWELLTRGCLPFHEVTTADEVRDYILQGYILGKPDTLSDDMYELLRSCWSSENEARPSIASVARSLSEILESDDDGTYANAGAVASYMTQHSSGLAATPRQSKGASDNIYSTTNLSRV